jgi:hypothetical protein
MMQEKFASCNHPSVKIGCRKQAFTLKTPVPRSMVGVGEESGIMDTVYPQLNK